MEQLIVVRPFGPWSVGDLVREEDDVASVLASEHADHVVRFHPPKEG